MILTDKKNTVETSGDFVTSGFKIKASKKAFEILSAGLYSDKIRAIIRELSTNAADAHVAAGKKDVRFEVHLPNSLEPWFAVKDFGTGLSDKQVQSVYTTYFESDKTDSNDYTGCLGLGSKSPFSYTDSFTVESRFDGILTIYNAFLNEEGLPTITKMTEDFTEETNGLTVKFPVNSGDFSAFRTKAEETLRWFKILPKVIGAATFAFEKKEYLLENEKFKISKSYSGRSYVVMGNVAYPIIAHEFLDAYHSEVRSVNKLVDWGVELFVNVGDVDISASREKLSYDKRTVKNLKELLSEALKSLQEEVTKGIQNAPTIWQARKKLHEVNKSFKEFDFETKWQGKEITTFIHVDGKEVEYDKEDGTKDKRWKENALAERLEIRSKNGNRLNVKKKKVEKIYADGSPIFINDGRGAYAAVRNYLQNKDINIEVYLLSDVDRSWLDETGISEVAVKTSTLPKPTRESNGSGRGTVEKAKIYEFDPHGGVNNGGSASAKYWQPVDVEIEEGGVYVEILYFNWRMGEGKPTQTPELLNTPLNILKNLGKGVKLYGIRPADKDLLEEGDWQTLQEYIVEVVQEGEFKYLPELEQVKDFDQLSGGYNSYEVPFRNVKGLYDQPAFNAFREKVEKAKSLRKDVKVKAYYDLRVWLNLPSIESKGSLVKSRDEIYAKYPLLQYISSSYGDEFDKAITEYIALIDGGKKKEGVNVLNDEMIM